MPDWLVDLAPFITAVMGFAAAYAPALWQARREREARQHEREAAFLERREAFELSHLVEFNGLLRTCVDQLHEFSAAERAYSLRREETQRDYGAAQKAMDVAEVNLRAQVGFILADNVRECAEEATRALSHAVAKINAGEPSDLRRFDDALNAVYEALSARVREIYAGRS